MPRYVALCLIVLTACAPRGHLTIDPDAGQVGQIETILVGSSRELNDKDEPGTARAEGMHYGRFEVSIPPAHEPGKIEWPYSNPDPTKHFLTQSATNLSGVAGFEAALSRELRGRPRGDRQVVLFVHGYNSLFAEGLYRFAQMRTDVGIPDVAVHYSWPSGGNPFGYVYDRDSMLFARDGLEEMINAVVDAGAEGIVLVGHSMGSLLIMETIRQMAIRDPKGFDKALDGVILVSPDVDIDLFKKQAQRIGPLPQPFVIFSSSRDVLLRLSASLTGRKDRLGNIEDFEELAELDVTVVDVSAFTDAESSHITAIASPAFLRLIDSMGEIDSSLQGDPSQRIGLLPGTVLVVQNATAIILTPLLATGAP
ncbi:alpha/beta fold hydrolase [Aliiroseovarius subalbicans]|uniref:alpha/beta hydrolase n=1 Tax=Aliiroseovarius subalbicans TaxID=2925840 RepID=UPI001F580488|nr:alpha/beta fold hydrolase [Aliiroseovarius subalbicans]MCI2400079.1 alpha/beta fold hydrolase [Aliiroseovarius subalbicans]